MRTVGLIVCLTGLAVGPALAEDYPGRAPTPPDGFDVLHASDAARAYYRLPARPVRNGVNSAAAAAAWTKGMAAARHYVTPELRMTGRRHGPERVAVQGSAAARQGVMQGLRASAQTTASTNWTGESLVNGVASFGSGAFNQALGLWVIPSVQQPVGTCGGTDVSAIWVGLDGFGASSDVLQAGTEGDVSCVNSDSTPTIYPWFEWFPDYSFEITNFPLAVGSSVFVSVEATSATTGQAMIVNLQTGAYTTTPITPPSGTRLTGNSVEWIMERPTLEDNKLGTLSDFGVAMMCYELAQVVGVSGSVSPGAPGAGQSSYLITMVNDGTTIAEAAAMGPTGQAFSVQGPTK